MRRGLVLGGGGVLGAAWMVGALTAYEEAVGIDAREVDAVVGTSAGSVIGSLLMAGVSVGQLRTHQLTGEIDHGPLRGFTWNYDEDSGGSRPPTPKVGFGSPTLLRKGIGELRHLPPTAVLAALVPEGRGSLESVGAMIGHVVPSGWVQRPGLSVVAVDYDQGERVVFGQADAPRADLRDAVMASCAIPGWYPPMVIGDRRYIDGGAWSPTNADLLSDAGLDEVHILAPLISFDPDAPSNIAGRLERQWRTRVTARALAEAEQLGARGVEVVVIGPGREDLEAFGFNLMDVSRRPKVLETSLRTSRAALADPATVEAQVAGLDELGHGDEVDPDSGVDRAGPDAGAAG